MTKPRILLADDHSLIIEGLRSVLCGGSEVVGVAGNGRDLVEAAERLKPDAIFIDIGMPVLNGMEAARQIRTLLPSAKLLFLTQRSDREYIRAALDIGASAYILKQNAVLEAGTALEEVLAGRYYISPLLRAGIPDAVFFGSSDPSSLFGRSLTPRQREVLQLVAEGKSNKEIAAVLNISVKTVDFHKSSIMSELNLHSTADLTRYALEHGLVSN